METLSFRRIPTKFIHQEIRGRLQYFTQCKMRQVEICRMVIPKPRSLFIQNLICSQKLTCLIKRYSFNYFWNHLGMKGRSINDGISFGSFLIVETKWRHCIILQLVLLEYLLYIFGIFYSACQFLLLNANHAFL